MKRYWEVEFLRGVAAILVCWHHYAYWLFAQQPEHDIARFLHFFHSGVDLFFVISGFVFAPYLLGQVQIAWRRFLVHRWFRIYPLYLLSLLILVLFSGKPLDWSMVLQHVFFVQTMQSMEAATYYSLVYWTLPVEWEFYFFSMLLMMVLAKWAWLRRGVVFYLSCLLLLSGLLLIWAGRVLPLQAILFFGHLPVLLCEFLLGSLVFWSLQFSGGQNSKNLDFGVAFLKNMDRYAWELPLVLVFGLGLLWMYWHDPSVNAYNPRPLGGFTWASSGMYALLLRWMIRHEVVSLRFPKLCARLGEMSYGLYVFHAAIGAGMVTLFRSLGWSLELALLLAIVVGVVVGLLCFHFIEAPMMRWGKQWARRFN